jgi:hypothetical protein
MAVPAAEPPDKPDQESDKATRLRESMARAHAAVRRRRNADRKARGFSPTQLKAWQNRRARTLAQLRRTLGSNARMAFLKLEATYPDMRSRLFEVKWATNEALALWKYKNSSTKPSTKPSTHVTHDEPDASPRLPILTKTNDNGKLPVQEAAKGPKGSHREAIAFASGYIYAWLTNYAESANIPRSSLTEGVGELLLNSARR